LQEKYGITWSYWQDVEYNDPHAQWDWDKMSAACNPLYPTIMMVCLGVPRQELWSYENHEYLKRY
jgi:UDP-N-acetyl-D-mannosaminuronic acid transferase (WecB/TagA/CpsF family)